MLIEARGKVVDVSSEGGILAVPWGGMYTFLICNFPCLLFQTSFRIKWR